MDEPTNRKIRVVRRKEKRQVNREIQFCNLDMVISVGYCVNSIKATQFRNSKHRIHEIYQKTDTYKIGTLLRKCASVFCAKQQTNY